LRLNSASDDPDLDAQLIKAYNTLSFYGGQGSLFTITELSSDELVVPRRGGDWFDGGIYINLHRHQYTPSDPFINNTWQILYAGIVQCNKQLYQYSKITDLPTQGYVAELRAIRALYYFYLLDLFRNVPLITEYFPSNPGLPSAATPTELFDFVANEIDAAIPDLSAAPLYGRFNQSAARALKAKLYLNKGVYTGSPDWATTLALCNTIINEPYYSLEANYFDNFKTNNNSSPETIFQIPYDAVTLQGFNIGMMTLHYASQATFSLTQQPWNGYSAVEDFYNSFASDDDRKSQFLVGVQRDTVNHVSITDPSFDGDPDGPEVNFTPAINNINNAYRQAGARIMKWEYALGATESLSNDFAVFRLADIILMRAECEFHLANLSAALADVNLIRARAGTTLLGSVTATDILNERGKEFFAENWRRQDLIRFGAFNNAWWEKPASSVTKNIFPIPIPQIIANPNLTQNPGY
jgi:hypothetical protein